MANNSGDRNDRFRSKHRRRFPPAIDPFDTDHITYVRRLEVYNQHLQREIQRSLESLWDGQPEHFAVATSGSDGRFEKAPQSKMEVILLHDASFDSREISIRLKELIRACPDILWDIDESKPLGDSSKPISGYHGDSTKLYPTRMFDAELLSGNPAVFLGGLEQQERELLAPIGEKCFDNMVQRRKDSLGIMRTGSKNFRGKPIVHFDLGQGFSYYTNPHLTDGGAGSFKFGPLRAVQYRLASDLISAYRTAARAGKPLPFTLDDIPKNIHERLLWLETAGFTSLPVP